MRRKRTGMAVLGSLLLMMSCSMMMGASPQALGSDSAGQLLYAPSSGKFYVFREVAPDGTKWICTPHGNMTRVTLDPRPLKILDLYENDEPYAFGLYALEVMLSGKNQHYWKLVRNHPSNRVIAMREYLKRERLFREKISLFRNKMNRAVYEKQSLKRVFGKKNKKEDLEREQKVQEAENKIENLKGDLENILLTNNLCQLIEYVRDKHDHFTSFVLFRRYRQLMQMMPDYGDEAIITAMRKHMRSMENNLCRAFNADRQRSAQMVADFRKACPGMLGKWSELSPTTAYEMERYLRGVMQSFHKSRNLSPRFEFPQWGNAVLDVIVMAPEDPDTANLKDQFNKNLRRYKTKKR